MRTKTKITSLLLAGALVVAGCSPDTDTSDDGDGTPQPGGEVTVLLDAAFSGSWPTGLDPATNSTGGANLTQMSAIYGGLFLLVADDDGSNARVEPHQAESFEYADGGRTLKIHLRPGITFTDGTPLDADAVVFNFIRDVTGTCFCRPQWVLASDDPTTPTVIENVEDDIFAEDDDTVVVRFANPSAIAVSTFVVSNVNWIASPTAIETQGEDDFRNNPVGAGPFMVEENIQNTKLTLVKNPNYFREGRPYLDRLIVQSIGGDQPAYNAVVAGQGDVYEGLTTISLVEQARNNPQVVLTQQPATSPYVIQLNTRIPPFDDKRAREAIYYATDVDAIREGLFRGNYPAAQTFTAPGGLFHHDTIPGYRTYDLEQARAIIEEIGLDEVPITLGTLASPVADQVNAALEQQWEEAGLDVTIESWQLQELVEQFGTGQWQAMLQTAGAWDPAVGVGVSFRFTSTAPFSGVSNEEIDELLTQAAQTNDPDERDALYLEVGQIISDEAYAPYILAFAPATLSRPNVHGPGIDTLIPPVVVNTGILWDEVWVSQT